MKLNNKILSDITVHMKYAKYLPELNRRETWEELVTRNKGMHLKQYPHINCNQIAGTVNQGIWLNDCDPCVESAYQIPNITQWLRHRFAVTAAGSAVAGPINVGDIANAAVISQWDDAIGSNNAVQATGADQPVWNDADTNILFATSDNLSYRDLFYKMLVLHCSYYNTVCCLYCE